MKIAIVGYGKMGHMIEQVAKNRGNEVVLTIDPFAKDASLVTNDATKICSKIKEVNVEGIIEFTHPSVVEQNIKMLLPLGIPLVVGTTGWLSKLEEIKTLAKKSNSNLFYSANFSVGVNLFYKIVAAASSLISDFDEYDVALWEAHHNTKADSPSGTALKIADYILENMNSKTEIVNGNFSGKPCKNQLQISTTRVGSVPGTHTVYFDSSADTIELKHTARSREGFALGAVRSVEWLSKGLQNGSLKKGEVYTMDDMLCSQKL